GVVDEDIDAAIGLGGAGHHRLDLALVGDVAADAGGGATPPGDPFRALARVVGVDVDAHQPRALVGQALGDAAPDVGARPRHHRDLAGQSGHREVPTSVVAGATAAPARSARRWWSRARWARWRRK